MYHNSCIIETIIFKNMMGRTESDQRKERETLTVYFPTLSLRNDH